MLKMCDNSVIFNLLPNVSAQAPSENDRSYSLLWHQTVNKRLTKSAILQSHVLTAGKLLR